MSVSRKGVWDECQQKYKYRYHLGTKMDIPEPPYFLYGSVVHKICEEYINFKGQKSIGEIAGEVLDGTIQLDKRGKEESGPIILDKSYKKKLPDHLYAFKRFNDKIIAAPGEMKDITEWEFKYDLNPPNEYNLVGFIDRLIIKKDKVFIIDYKTTKKSPWRKNITNISSDLQLRTYARVVQKTLGIKPQNIHAALFYFEGGELVGSRFSEESLELAEKELLKAFREILETEPDKVLGSLGNHCKRCDFVTICPFYSIT